MPELSTTPVISLGALTPRSDAEIEATALDIDVTPAEPTTRPLEAEVGPVRPTLRLTRFELRAPFDERLWLLAEPGSEQSRALRLVRHRLLAEGDPRVVLVTSAFEGEGKTTTAACLALAIAEESSSRVLLLDANLRRPAVASLFGAGAMEGVLEAVDSHSYPLMALSGTNLRLSLAHTAPGPDAQLDRTRVRRAVSDLSSAHDYVVIDAASVLESADVDVLAEVSDAVVVAARAGKTRKSDLARALDALAPARVAGVVLVGT